MRSLAAELSTFHVENNTRAVTGSNGLMTVAVKEIGRISDSMVPGRLAIGNGKTFACFHIAGTLAWRMLAVQEGLGLRLVLLGINRRTF